MWLMVIDTLGTATCSVVFVGFASGLQWKSVASLSAAIFSFASGDSWSVFCGRLGVLLSIGLLETLLVLCEDFV